MPTTNEVQRNKPAVFTIFGATGDLSCHKLFPALISLYEKERLPDSFRIVGVSRKDWADKHFRDFLRDKLAGSVSVTDDVFNDFLQAVHFEPGDVTDTASFDRLYDRLQTIDTKIGACTDKLFYLAVSPHLFADTIDNFADSRLMSLCDDPDSWTRMLVEKPFGTDLEAARDLDDKFCSVFAADQLFRIDHYLGKSALQNILAFRFFNGMFAGSWNHEFIDSIHLQLLESNKVSGRGQFYDRIGAFRDVGQNHLLQMLALLTMEPPQTFSADAIRNSRSNLVADLHCFTESDELQNNMVLGQYEGFLETQGVSTSSKTETYFLVKTWIENSRWENVPVFLESGKALNEKIARAKISFSQPTELAENMDISGVNELTITFQPEPRFTFDVLMNTADLEFSLERKETGFSYQESTDLPGAYESVLLRAIKGDQTIFASRDEVNAGWEFTMPIVEKRDDVRLHTYEPGSSGPETRKQLLARSNGN